MRKLNNKSPEARKQQRLRKLGTNNPICPVCGETDWRVFQSHHISGQNNDPDLTHPLCSNCHCKISDAQKDHPEDVSDPADHLGRIAHFMLGLAELLVLIVESLRDFADILFNHPSRAEWCSEAQS